jgi:hypothetical protein
MAAQNESTQSEMGLKSRYEASVQPALRAKTARLKRGEKITKEAANHQKDHRLDYTK